MKKLLLFLVLMVSLGGCATESTHAPSVGNDNSGASWKDVHGNAPRAPVDNNLYVIRGTVIADVKSLTRQTDPGGGYILGANGFISGGFVGATNVGKGMVRLHVQSLSPEASFFKVGDIIIVKTSDTKAAALLPNDIVEFKCRAQFESVAPIKINEVFNKEKYGTFELDFCRMSTPRIGGE